MKIKFNTAEPIHTQIADQLKEQILSGKITKDSPLPSERTLACDLRINTVTVMKAYEMLSDEKLISATENGFSVSKEFVNE